MPVLATFLLAAALAGAPAADGATDTARPAMAESLGQDQLDGLRGGDSTIVSEQTLQAVNSGNTVAGSVVGSGDISFNAGALADFNGIGNFTMNTGHNNNLQSSISVNIVMAPAVP